MHRLIVIEKDPKDGFEYVLFVGEGTRADCRSEGEWYQKNRKDCRYILQKVKKGD